MAGMLTRVLGLAPWLALAAAAAAAAGRGAFVIADVPAGEHVVELWHEPANGEEPGTRMIAKVKVSDGKRARLDLTFPL